MQKDFKIGLAIGVTLAAGACIWLATLPNLSARARALEAASNIKPSSKTPPYVSSSRPSPDSEIRNTPASSAPVVRRVEPVEGSNEAPATTNEQRTMPAPSDGSRVTSNEQPHRIHVVQRGDTLSSISAKYYGSANQWRKIVFANRNNLPDPNRLAPGVKLIIPQ